jgi:hypothetical protein
MTDPDPLLPDDEPEVYEPQDDAGAGPVPGSNGQVPHVDWTVVEQHAGWLKTADDLPEGFSAKGRVIVAHHGTINDLNAALKKAGLAPRKPYKSIRGIAFALASIFKQDQRFTLEQIAAALLCKLDCNKYITTAQDSVRHAVVEQLLQRSYQPPGEPNWRERRVNGSPLPSMHNARLGIVAMGIECRHDLFRDVTIMNFTGDNITHEVKPLIGELTNAALLRLRSMFSDRFGFDVEDKHILDAVKTLAFTHCFDPVLDMLAKAETNWDGVERLDEWVMTYLKCKDTSLNRAIGRKVLIAACRRARVPGCKFDNITVLESPEGWNKSTAIRVLAGDRFFTDQSIIGARDKEVQEQLTGKWMHESADLTGMRRADVEHVKAFASRQFDRGRPAYGRVVENIPRRSIEWGSTNDAEYLLSQTGNRRFWPLAVGVIDIEALTRDRLQLLGEAAKYESAGEAITLDEALWSDAAIAQEQRRTKDPWEDILAFIPESTARGDGLYHLPADDQTVQIIYYDDPGDVSGKKKQLVASADLLLHVLRLNAAQQHDYYSKRLANVMKRLGWQRDENKITINGKQVRGFFRWVVDKASHVASPRGSHWMDRVEDDDDPPF